MADSPDKTKEDSLRDNTRNGEQPEEGLFDRMWIYFGNLKVVVVLLIIIAVVSVLGTFILQNGREEEYVRVYGIGLYNLVASSFLQKFIPIDYDVDPQRYVEVFGSWAYKNLHALGLTHVYSSWWYVLLLAMIGFSIFVCSTNRFNSIMERRGGKLRDYNPDSLLNFSNSVRVAAAGGSAWATEMLERTLGRFRYKLRLQPAGEGKINFEAEKGSLRYWGSFLTHVSILVIFAGALLGKYGGYESFTVIPEGESHYEARGGFWVRLNDFTVEYDEMMRPLEYTSDLSVFEDGKEVLRKKIEVNKPLIYKGIYFYQSSFGAGTIEVKAEGPGGTAESIFMKPNRPSSDFSGLPALYFASDDIFADKNSPRVFLRYVGSGGSIHGIGWLTRDAPLEIAGRQLTLGDMWQYSGLQIKKDPGIPVVWLGCTMLVVGMLMMFYIRNRRVFGTVHAAFGEGAHVTAAGVASRGDDGFREEFERFGDALRKAATQDESAPADREKLSNLNKV